jgi:Rrf2 family cysteine metabolism transcriptional repressor
MGMKITYKGDYALKAVLDLSLHHGRELVTIGEMAKRINAPIKFLEQIMLDLKRAGFIESRRGKVGGYLLAKSPAQIRVGDIVRLIEGPTEPIACVNRDYSACDDLYRCAFRKIWQDVASATSNIIDSITFEQLVTQIESSKDSLLYSI